MLDQEIESAQRLVRTDAYQMSVGEIVNMYQSGEIIINPDFQRLFRWDIGQKSKFIESLLLGIPVPSIFVFETNDGKWELIDGLQRISTILEFMGFLKNPDGRLMPPSVLTSTRYLPSLGNAVWDDTVDLNDLPSTDQKSIGKNIQIAIRRSRIGVEILKRPSDESTKFDLFQRLNAGGTQANAQEIRNCIMIMVNNIYYYIIRSAADDDIFQRLFYISDEQKEKQKHMEMATRFLVHTFVPYDGKLDVEEYIDEGVVYLARNVDPYEQSVLLKEVFRLLNDAVGQDALRRYDGFRYVGKVGLVGLEGIAVGVAKNLGSIKALGDSEAVAFVGQRAREFWLDSRSASFTSPGLRGTTRIQRTVNFGAEWFRP